MNNSRTQNFLRIGGAAAVIIVWLVKRPRNYGDYVTDALATLICFFILAFIASVVQDIRHDRQNKDK